MKFPSFMRIAVNQLRGVCELSRDIDGKITITEGSDAEFLEILSESLHFKYELFEPEDKQWGVEINGNWTGLIGKVHRNETDLSICAVTITEARQKAVHYSYTYELQQMIFATRAPKQLPKVMAFVYPFSAEVWFTVLLLMCLMPFVWRILLKTKHPFRRLFTDAYASFLSGSTSVSLVSFSDSILVATWLFGTCFLAFSYTAVLLSFLTLPLQENLVRNIPQLAKAVEEGRYKALSFKGTWLFDALKNSSVEGVSLIGREMVKNDVYVGADKDAIKTAVYESNAAVIAMRSFFEDTFGDALALSEDTFFPIQLGLITNKDFCCKDYLDEKLRWMVAAGLYQKCKRHFQFRERTRYMNNNSAMAVGGVEPLSLEDLSGAFIMLCFGYGVSVVSFAAEICLPKIIEKLKKKQTLNAKWQADT